MPIITRVPEKEKFNWRSGNIWRNNGCEFPKLKNEEKT